MAFKAKFEGRCGICKLRIRKGDNVVWIPPTNIKFYKAYDHQRLTGGYEKLVVTKVAHESCKRMIEGTYNE